MLISGKSKKTILIVDDEDIELNRCCQILRREGYKVLQADGYGSAVSVAEGNRRRVDLLVADVSLPDGDACDLALRLRDRLPNLRVLFVSGKAGAEICRFYGLEQNCLHFLRKPFTAGQLSERVHRVMNNAEPFPYLFPKYRIA
uniref:Response regulator receiver protein n=1 Tax=Solibacter usitatus (strain Ellin6076) TaxID=234267 RepID=Q01RH5_SOLUE